MGMALPMGGHLTHGWPVSVTGKWFRSVQYGVREDTGRVDFDEVRDLALQERPKLIFCGGTAIPRTIDFPAFAEIAGEVGAVLVADIAHIAGLIAGGAHPVAGRLRRRDHHHHAQDAARPARRHDHVPPPSTRPRSTRRSSPACRAARTTTPRRRSRSRCRRRRSRSSATYAHQVVANAKALAAALAERGFDLVSGGTDNHLILVDLTHQGHRRASPPPRRSTGPGIELNYNTVPFDPRKPFDPSGHPARHARDHHPRPGRGSTCRRSPPGWTRRSRPR